MSRNLRALPLLLIIAGCSNQGRDFSAPKEPSIETRFAVKSIPDRPVQAIPFRRSLGENGAFSRLLPEQTGVDFICRLDTNHPLRQIYYSGYVCGGVAMGDVDNDGRVDLFLVNGAESNRLYRQVDEFRFEDITATAGVGGGDAWGTGAAMIDIDNDLDLDLYICNYDAPNQLYINQGGARFVESARRWGLDIQDASFFPAFSDFDRDGDLDLYLLTNRLKRAGGRPAKPPYTIVDGKPVVRPEYAKFYAVQQRGPGQYDIDGYGRDDYLLRNNGTGSFQDVTHESGIYGHGDGLSATWFDYDSDGWPDLYVCNDFNEPDRLYRNNGDGTFSDRLVDAFPHTSWFSMGSDAADINNDGLLDLFVLDMAGTNHFKQKTTMGAMNASRLAAVAGPPPQYMRNALFLNAGGGRFMEIAYLAGLAHSDWSWAAKLADLDNDGLVDAFVSNGTIRNFNDSDTQFSTSMLIGRTEWDIYQHTGPRREQNLAFRNDGDFSFSDVSKSWGLDHVGMSYGTAWGDLDNDGDLDLVVANIDEPTSIYRNDVHSGHGVTFRLIGQASNRFGLGATIELSTALGRQIRELSPMTGFLSCNHAIIHFGLGNETIIEQVTVRWPSGRKQTFQKLPADHHFIVREPESAEPPTAPRSGSETERSAIYEQVAEFPKIMHQNQESDDFALQPLLPFKLSQFGPGIVWGDIDDDGDDDLFVGGGAGQAGSLWINLGDGEFRQCPSPALQVDAEHDDLGSLFLDADGDGDLDLYVASGGANKQLNRDRLYLNQGQGELELHEDALPDQPFSGSVVTANDFDRDGDLDLFVGSRMVPGQYPMAPRSQLLRNDNGRFTDVTMTVASELAQSGMVTGAVWSDANADGVSDLLVTYDWGPVRLFVNHSGTLRDATEQFGLSAHTGWWNGIASGDVDNDGDIDYVATNVGLNTKYHASPSQPALLYYGDFDNTGRMRLVEAEFEDHRLVPIRGKSCSTQAMPFLNEKFSSYKGFALADLEEIYTHERLQAAHRFAATTFASCLLLNEGDHFKRLPLPRLAQNSPSFGVALADVNADGWLDVYLVQNFWGPQPETGRWDGGLSLLMLGRGNGEFETVWPMESGLVVPEDAKSLAVVDLNADAWPDFVSATHRGPVRAFRHNRSEAGSRRISVRLKGPRLNPSGVGSTVILHLDNGTQFTREIQAGSGYLSQSSPVAFFAFPETVRANSIEVRWYDGRQQWETAESERFRYTIAYPSQS